MLLLTFESHLSYASEAHPNFEVFVLGPNFITQALIVFEKTGKKLAHLESTVDCSKWAVDEHCTFTTIFTTLSSNIEPASRARTGLWFPTNKHTRKYAY